MPGYGRKRFYLYPEGRFIAKLTGTHEAGRRPVSGDKFRFKLGGETFMLGTSQWVTPFINTESGAVNGKAGGAAALRVPVGRGSVILLGSYPSTAYMENAGSDFEKFVRAVAADAGWAPAVRVVPEKGNAYVQYGSSSGKTVIFLFAENGGGECRLGFPGGSAVEGNLKDVISGERYRLVREKEETLCRVKCGEWGVGVFIEEKE